MAAHGDRDLSSAALGVITPLSPEMRRAAQMKVAEMCLQGDHPVEDTEHILDMLGLNQQIEETP